jgi:hypothetical protein
MKRNPYSIRRLLVGGAFLAILAGCGAEPDEEGVPDAEVAAEAEPQPSALIPAETVLRFEVLETASTETHDAGDALRLRLVEGVHGTGGAHLDAGSSARAVITESRESGGSDEQAVLALDVTTIQVNGSEQSLRGTIQSTDIEAGTRDSGQRTAATVATGAAAGAILGQVLGRDTRSTTAGAAAGAVAGLGIALTTRDGHAVLPEGSLITVRLEEPLVVR